MADALMITYNRLNYTKKALTALANSDCEKIFIVDNGSTDGSLEWVSEIIIPYKSVHVYQNPKNSIASAMNYFIRKSTSEYLIKVDNDTLIPKDFCYRMSHHMKYADMVQAKHHIVKATNPGGWYGFTNNMKKENGLLYNHFIGGSGIMFKRNKVRHIPETDWILGGWRQWQREHPAVVKAFCEDVEVELLDSHGYEDYPDYYLKTGRINAD